MGEPSSDGPVLALMRSWQEVPFARAFLRSCFGALLCWAVALPAPLLSSACVLPCVAGVGLRCCRGRFLGFFVFAGILHLGSSLGFELAYAVSPSCPHTRSHHLLQGFCGQLSSFYGQKHSDIGSRASTAASRFCDQATQTESTCLSSCVEDGVIDNIGAVFFRQDRGLPGIKCTTAVQTIPVFIPYTKHVMTSAMTQTVETWMPVYTIKSPPAPRPTLSSTMSWLAGSSMGPLSQPLGFQSNLALSKSPPPIKAYPSTQHEPYLRDRTNLTCLVQDAWTTPGSNPIFLPPTRASYPLSSPSVPEVPRPKPKTLTMSPGGPGWTKECYYQGHVVWLDTIAWYTTLRAPSEPAGVPQHLLETGYNIFEDYKMQVPEAPLYEDPLTGLMVKNPPPECPPTTTPASLGWIILTHHNGQPVWFDTAAWYTTLRHPTEPAGVPQRFLECGYKIMEYHANMVPPPPPRGRRIWEV